MDHIKSTGLGGVIRLAILGVEIDVALISLKVALTESPVLQRFSPRGFPAGSIAQDLPSMSNKYSTFRKNERRGPGHADHAALQPVRTRVLNLNRGAHWHAHDVSQLNQPGDIFREPDTCSRIGSPGQRPDADV